MKLSYINLSLIFITIFFITLNTISIDALAASGNIQKFPTYRDDSGWKVGEGKKDNGSGPGIVMKRPIKDNSKSLMSGCLITFVIIPCALLLVYILYVIFKPNKNLLQ